MSGPGEEEERWESETVAEALARIPERRDEFETASGIPVDRLYLPEERDYLEELSFPGEFPYTRGVYPTMYRSKLWTMREYTGMGDPEATNERFRFLLSEGQTGLSVAFDLPTQIGYDSDHELAKGEVGKVGVAIDHVEDMDAVFRGIPLDEVSTSMTINAPAAVILAMYVGVAKERGIPIDRLAGTVQNDVLKEYIARGTYIYPPEASLKLTTDVFEYCSERLPKWNTISVSGYHMREAGSTAVQEVAFTLANALEYVGRAVDVGLDVDDFAPRISFFFASHSDFFEEIAKFRAARRLWARLMKRRFSPQNPRSLLLRFHTQTSGATLTAQQPETNVVRVALQALAAVLGGTQSLHTNAMDEAIGLPTEKSSLLALRTQQIIAHESGVEATVDPVGGSYYLEWLTDEIEERALGYLQEIEDMGGMVRAIEEGYVQREIERSAYQHQRAVDRGDRVVVGVNEYVDEDEELDLEITRVEGARERQMERLEDLKEERSDSDVRAALNSVSRAAREGENLMPHLVDAATARCTLGEICDELREVYGEYRP